MNDRRDDIRRWRLVIESQNYRIVVKRVGLALANEFAVDGTIGISKTHLATRAGVSKDSVDSAIRQFVADGFLIVEPSVEDDGSAGPNFYSIPPTEQPAKPTKKRASSKKDAEPAEDDSESESE